MASVAESVCWGMVAQLFLDCLKGWHAVALASRRRHEPLRELRAVQPLQCIGTAPALTCMRSHSAMTADAHNLS
eukprot:CAMPEP_0171262534 /NCGR_PEP_ID=MMETSP0790-20130122/56610_1 /TAXON_ID=2925 /ORGANISM="Alexandrium catenella, Strain OF101" /LENGTH=73 /DNA_ID=CAMNT_0011731077 /DNA_START=136 /DNA_END=354 /DNA_ORIENTATION=-